MILKYGHWFLDALWFCFLLGLLVHFWGKRRVLFQAQSWLKAKGHVTHCEWVQVGHNIWPKIEYSYQVYDKDLVGSYLFLDTLHNNPSSSYSRRVAYRVALAFKEHTEIDVFYNPNHPDQSALDVTMPVKLNVILFLISALLIIHIATIVYRLGIDRVV